MERLSVVGKRLPKIDAVIKATGQARYTSDISMSGILYGKILRSPYPHAKILNIDTSRAERLKGVKAIIKGKDTLGIKYGAIPGIPSTMDEQALPIDKVRYIGEGVGAVAAVDEDTAEEALELIKVEYEELPAVFDPEEAMAEGSPKIHDNAERNISFSASLNFGDVERGFKEAFIVREDKFSSQQVIHASLETHSSLAEWDSSGKLTLRASTQGPHNFQRDLALTLGIPEGKIRVIKPYVGGGFGGKIEMTAIDFCASLLAQKSGRPVKITYIREEEFLATRRRHPMIVQLKTGVKEDGTIIAIYGKIVADGGAYNSLGPIILFQIGAFLSLLYRVPNVKYDGFRVYTNKPPCGAQRGFGSPQMRFAYESHLDMIAEDLGMDPLDLRLKNANQPNDVTVSGIKITSCGFTECLDRVAELIEWERRNKPSKGRGIGLAGGTYLSGASAYLKNPSAAFIKILEDGTVSLLTGASDIGQGADTTLCQIVAEEMGVRLENVVITSADTQITPLDLGTYSSRVTFQAGNAAKAAAQDAKRQILEYASEKLEANPEDLVIQDGQIYVKGSPEKGIRFSSLVRELTLDRGMPILGKGYFCPDTEVPNLETGEGNTSLAYSFGAQAAELEVDRDTGLIKVLRMVSTHDCGRAVLASLVISFVRYHKYTEVL